MAPAPSKHADAIRVSEALSRESTQEVGSDATNMASPMDSVPAVAADPQGDALATVMRHDEGERGPQRVAALQGRAHGRQCQQGASQARVGPSCARQAPPAPPTPAARSRRTRPRPAELPPSDPDHCLALCTDCHPHADFLFCRGPNQRGERR